MVLRGGLTHEALREALRTGVMEMQFQMGDFRGPLGLTQTPYAEALRKNFGFFLLLEPYAKSYARALRERILQ